MPLLTKCLASSAIELRGEPGATIGTGFSGVSYFYINQGERCLRGSGVFLLRLSLTAIQMDVAVSDHSQEHARS